MSRYSKEFVETFATIVAKFIDIVGGPDVAERAIEFAWFSVGSTGDAAIDDKDFMRHLGEWVREEGQ